MWTQQYWVPHDFYMAFAFMFYVCVFKGFCHIFVLIQDLDIFSTMTVCFADSGGPYLVQISVIWILVLIYANSICFLFTDRL